MIKTHCPHCEAFNKIPEAYLGRSVTCPSCQDHYLAQRPIGLNSQEGGQAALLPNDSFSAAMISNHSRAKVSAIIPVLICLFIIIYVYVNRTSILPPSKNESAVDRSPAMAVRPSIEIWEYKVERYRHALIADKSEDIVSRSFDDAKEATAVFIDESKLDSHGREGWELVSTYLEMETAFYNFGKYDLHTGIKENVRPQAVVAIFKRPKS